MDRFACGLVIALVGMGGTLIGLYVIVYIALLMKRLFPCTEREELKGKEGAKCRP